MKKEAKTPSTRHKGKIATKILVSIIVVNVVIVLALGSIIGFLVRTNVSDLSSKYTQTQVDSNINEIDQNFLTIEKLVDGIAAEIAVDVDVNKGKSDIQYLRSFCDSYEEKLRQVGLNTKVTNSIYVYFNNSYFGDTADCWVYSKSFERQPMIEKDYYKDYHEWYNAPVDKGITEWTFPYAGTSGGTIGSLITSYVKPIMKDNQIIGMVGSDLDLADVSKMISSITLYKTGYLYMMDAKGDVIVHKNIPWLDSDNDGNKDKAQNILSQGKYQFLLDDMAAHDKNSVEYKRSDGVSVVAAYGHLVNGWVIGSSIPTSEVYAINNMIITVIIIIIVIAILVSILIGILLSQSISRPIVRVAKTVNKIKDGDFTARIILKTNDETRILADSVNEMVDNVSNLIRESQKTVTKLVDSSTTLAAMAEETNATIDQVGLTVTEISKANHEIADEAEKGTSVAQVIDERFSSILEGSNLMYETTKDVINRKESGLNAVGTLKNISESSQKSNQKISQSVSQLDERTSEITDIILTINSIAEQTNLLALNASIEAARAGDAGKGFAVVAEEIRKLAEDSGKATDEIRTIIQTIRVESQESVKIMGEVNQISQEQKKAVSNVDDIFAMIFHAIDEIIQGIENSSKELKGLVEQKNQIVDISSTLSSASEETAASTEEVTNAMSDQIVAVEEVAKNAEVLNRLSEELRQNISKFIIE